MADVGLGNLVSSTGRYRAKTVRNAVLDSHPFLQALKENGGIRRISGGRTVTETAKTGPNNTVSWVGEQGSVPLTDSKVLDGPEFNWKYMLGAATWTLAERYMNSGSDETKLVDIVTAKLEVLEDTMKNVFNEGALSAGTGSGGLQLNGLASLVSTTPTTGTVGGIDRSSANAAWFRNQKFDTASDWADGPVDAGNVKRFLDKGINATTQNSKSQVQIGLLGSTHWEYLSSAVGAMQQIVNKSGTAEVGFDRIVYRGIPMYYGSGVNYSGYTSNVTATRSYLLNLKPGGVNLVYHEKAEFDMLEPVNASDQAAVSRLMFTMATMTIGGLAKLNWVGFD